MRAPSAFGPSAATAARSAGVASHPIPRRAVLAHLCVLIAERAREGRDDLRLAPGHDA